ncbi:ubiquitin-related domain-containing protein [Paraphysoderma sedebokerense]|nr:ubiquitin-related domain-containing protein [Paraphysoderma sedebokerense]
MMADSQSNVSAADVADAAEEKSEQEQINANVQLTAEQKAAKLEELKQKMAARRIERQREEKEQAKERERLRRKAGQDMTEVKKALEEKEMAKILEQKKREKAEEKAAKAKIMAQIEADRRERQRKAQEAKSGSSGSLNTAATPTVQASTAPVTNYDTARLQIRVQGQAPLTESFQATDTLAHVMTWLSQKGVNGNLSMTFPRKVFGQGDMQKSLKELGLVPSAALMLT